MTSISYSFSIYPFRDSSITWSIYHLTLSMLLTILPISFINFSITPKKFTVSSLLIFLIITWFLYFFLYLCIFYHQATQKFPFHPFYYPSNHLYTFSNRTINILLFLQCYYSQNFPHTMLHHSNKICLFRFSCHFNTLLHKLLNLAKFPYLFHVKDHLPIILHT